MRAFISAVHVTTASSSVRAPGDGRWRSIYCSIGRSVLGDEPDSGAGSRAPFITQGGD
jgi:hypothetical protein